MSHPCQSSVLLQRLRSDLLQHERGLQAYAQIICVLKVVASFIPARSETELLPYKQCIQEMLRPFPNASALFEQYFEEGGEDACANQTHASRAEAHDASPKHETLEPLSVEEVLSSFDVE